MTIHKEAFDCLINSPGQYQRKFIENIMENMDADVMVLTLLTPRSDYVQQLEGRINNQILGVKGLSVILSSPWRHIVLLINFVVYLS